MCCGSGCINGLWWIRNLCKVEHEGLRQLIYSDRELDGWLTAFWQLGFERTGLSTVVYNRSTTPSGPSVTTALLVRDIYLVREELRLIV